MGLADNLTQLTNDVRLVYEPLPPITTSTVECDPAGLTLWLNNLANRVNEHEFRIIQLINAVQELQNAVICLEELVEALTLRVESLEKWRPTVELRLTKLQDMINNLQKQINVINDKITALQKIVNNHEVRIGRLESDMAWYNSRLPRSKASMPASYKLALGNINVMSANSGNASLNVGIFTSAAIENNDIYFY